MVVAGYASPMENDTIISSGMDPADSAPVIDEVLVAPELLTGELLVEEISIDGMCGVY